MSSEEVDKWCKSAERNIRRRFWVGKWCYVFIMISSVSLLSIMYLYSPEFSISQDASPSPRVEVEVEVEDEDECAGKHIYVLDLPSVFNNDILQQCKSLSPKRDMCDLLSNSGMGPMLNDPEDSVFSTSGWYMTNQFSLEVIFHNRMKHYGCLTHDYTKASAVYVPYYPGLEIGRYLKGPIPMRDATSILFANYLHQRPEWNKFGGRDHFLVVGRITQELSRADSGWGSRLLLLPEVKNMTSLIIESNPSSQSEVGIPYPTYFHPSTQNEIQSWQQKMRHKNRPYLFSFSGAPRPIRYAIIEQCLSAKGQYCKYLSCTRNVTDCIKPQTLMKLLQSSEFCLQPPGDSYTRKSIFDSILAGCIPVLFHPASAYDVYLWHLPKNHSTYSVFIPLEGVKKGSVSIQKRLLAIPKEQIKAMREQVIALIPHIVYRNPNTMSSDILADAFDIAVEGVLNRVQRIKSQMLGGL